MPAEDKPAAPPPAAPPNAAPRRMVVESPEGGVGGSLAPVKVMNATFTSLAFRVPGRSVNLAPREAAEVPRAYLETQELQALVRRGAVVVVTGSK